ncbi:alpha/beta hydrolase family protein [Paenibacillus sp. FJAT-27812]|uniref:alpha/beta hydrolase family protein n=1 Tax=Paenibacillus sp. FJAT-27812 TaxID=1684143 RepID=UPI0006A790FE|nr:alpha/beta fold hydrolase [Paenibacillus sp. FJAT-27812]
MTHLGILHQTFTLELGAGVFIKGDVRVNEEGGRKPVLLFAHGFKGFKDWAFFPYASERFARQDFAVVTFNFSHNGVNEHDFDELDKFGQNTYSQEQQDLSAVLSAVLEGKLPLAERLDNEQIVIVGHSRGGGNSVLLAAEHPEIRGVVTWNGIADVNLFGAAFREQVLQDGVGYVENARTKQQMPIGAVFFEDLDRNKEQLDITAKAAALRTPVLFIQGTQDSERLLEGYRSLQKAAPHHRFATLEGATHTFGAVHPFAGTTDDLERAIALTGAFFAPLLKRAAAGE